ncbi:inactive serine protease PAMR1 [Stegastes partitus]|uniref:Inactive serine protease PAMR1 n=1 Tax=Stegastes partitus TaxID=144197 RepID=A0A9Y4KM26_9TELE|nr:PREDICTED: inactive serine protease PAMR1-like [Stegastes partitus]
MCRPCCEYDLIRCRCPSNGAKVGYTVPCCRNAVDQCDPCIIHPGCSLFENCKTCHNGTWRANDDFFVNGKYCTECREGWSGGDCKTCGGVLQRAQGHVALESYPTNARCEWTVQVGRGGSVELRFSLLSLESDHNCRYDYVEVRDGDDLNSPVIGRYCGDRLPPPIKSSGNLVHILFVSDGYNNFDGFVLTFQEVSVSATKTAACSLPEKPLNGYLLPVYGPKEELVLVNHRCHPPFILTGGEQRSCLANGTWSGSVPSCAKGQTSPLRCVPPPKLLHGYHRAAAATVGGAETIEFFCKNSYILSVCREPKVSDLVRQSVVKPHLLTRQSSERRSSRYNEHDLLSAGFIPLTSGGVAPEQIPRGFHPVYTSIEYRCASPLYRTSGGSRRTCLKTGRWSGRHVSCSPVCGKLDTFSRHSVSDTRWPWHAAVYIRSPPDHAGSSHGSHGGAMPDQQGASEESSFWVLACSGALLAQRRVLVAAQCVLDKDTQRLLHPQHVKVVVGLQQQTARDLMKGPHQLRVSDISVHPDFPSSPDADVAVLRLKDKAKISERVLPVCLPRTQGGEVTAQEAYAVRWILPDSHKHLSHSTAASQTKLVELSDAAQCERAFAEGGSHTAALSDNTLCVISKASSSPSPCIIPGITMAPAGLSSVLSGHEEARGASGAAWQLLGLESFEKNSCSRQQSHTVQTRVANFRDWIEENMK